MQAQGGQDSGAQAAAPRLPADDTRPQEDERRHRIPQGSPFSARVKEPIY